MIHAFDSEVAQKYGIKEAILLNNFEWWVKKNAYDDRNFHDGRYWTYCSLDALSKLYPYMSKKSIQRAIDHLEAEGLIIKGNYNAAQYDRTTWYSVPMWSECPNAYGQNDQMDMVKMTTPIPSIKTSIKTDKYSALFEKLWKMYPQKRGKSAVTEKTKARIAEIGEEEMIRAIKRYVKGLEAEPWRQAQNGSTFFNSGYVDYLDENYEEVKPKPRHSDKYIPEPPKYQKFEKEEWEDTKAEAMPEEMRRKLKNLF